MDARTLLQCAYPGRAKARKLLNDEGFQQDWDQLFALTPDDGHPFTRRIRALIMAEAEQFERLVSELEALVLLTRAPVGRIPGTTRIGTNSPACFSRRAETYRIANESSPIAAFKC